MGGLSGNGREAATPVCLPTWQALAGRHDLLGMPIKTAWINNMASEEKRCSSSHGPAGQGVLLEGWAKLQLPLPSPRRLPYIN